MTDRDNRFIEQGSPEDSEAETTTQQTITDTPGEVNQTATVHHGKIHLFSAFCEKPDNVTFQTQEPDEHVLIFLRKSKWTDSPWIITTILLLFVPLLLYFFYDFSIAYFLPLKILFLLIPTYYLLVITYGFVNFIIWYFNAALITNKRVVDIDFHQIVYKDVAETKLALVQDVSYEQVGVLPNLLGYGFVLIQTAGTLDNFEFYSLPHPDRVEEIVEDLIGRRGGSV